jgi:hypothetical protein
LIRQPALDANLGWQSGAVVSLSEQTGRWPYLIQCVCLGMMELLDKKKDKKATLIDQELVDEVLQQITSTKELRNYYFGHLWEGDAFEPIHWMGRLILWALSLHSPAPMRSMEIFNWIQDSMGRQGYLPPNQTLIDEFKHELERLESALGVIVQRKNGQYAFGVPLVQTVIEQFVESEDDLANRAYEGLCMEVVDRDQRQTQQDPRLGDYFDE